MMSYFYSYYSVLYFQVYATSMYYEVHVMPEVTIYFIKPDVL